MIPQREKKGLFDSLVESAIDFAEKSLEELKKGNPKHSLIAFCVALELFLKARLMLEHWTLVVSNPAHEKPQTFEQGDFRSVSMEEAIQRLENVANERFSPQEKGVFKAIREQRNRMVHFFDPASATNKKRELGAVAAQEHRGWYYLHLMLTKRWKTEFARFHGRIERLGARLLEIREFLKVKFRELEPQIAAEKNKGDTHRRCPQCRFKAYRVIDEESSPPKSKLLVASCLVCELKEAYLAIECPKCRRRIEIKDFGEGECRCGFAVDTEWLAEELGPGGDPKEEADTAYCTECERTDVETVIPIDGESGYLCISCFATFSRIGKCGFCNSRNAGEISSVDSYLGGCVMCSGMTAEDYT